MVWSILSSFGIFVICTYIYTYIYVRRPRDNPLSGHVSRAPRCRTPIRPAIYADRAWRRRGGGPPRLNTEYENVCRLEFDFATDRSEVRGGSFSLSRIRSLFLLSAKFFFYYADRGGERGEEEGLSERYLERLRRYRPSPIIVRFRLGKSSWDGVARGNPRILLITFDKQTRLRHGILKLKGQIRSMHRWIGFTMVEGDAHSYFSEQ